MLLRSGEGGLWLGGSLLLYVRRPFVIGHAIDDLPRFGIGQRKAAIFGFGAIPFRQAVAAKAGQVHQIDVLNIGSFAQMFHEPAEGCGLEFGAGLVVHRDLLGIAVFLYCPVAARLKRQLACAAARRRISSIVRSSLWVAMNQR